MHTIVAMRALLLAVPVVAVAALPTVATDTLTEFDLSDRGRECSPLLTLEEQEYISWNTTNHCRGIELDLIPLPKSEDICSPANFAFTQWYRIELEAETAIQVRYQGAECARVISRDPNTAGQRLGEGGIAGHISEFSVERELKLGSMDRQIDKLPSGSYYIQLASNRSGDYGVVVCHADSLCTVMPPAPPPPPPPPEEPTPPPMPPEPSNELSMLPIIAAGLAVLLGVVLIAAWLIRRKARATEKGRPGTPPADPDTRREIKRARATTRTTETGRYATPLSGLEMRQEIEKAQAATAKARKLVKEATASLGEAKTRDTERLARAKYQRAKRKLESAEAVENALWTQYRAAGYEHYR